MGAQSYSTSIYKTTYQNMSQQDPQLKSTFPPGYAGHQHDNKFIFGFSNPGAEKAGPGMFTAVSRPASEVGDGDVYDADPIHKPEVRSDLLYRTASLPVLVTQKANGPKDLGGLRGYDYQQKRGSGAGDLGSPNRHRKTDPINKDDYSFFRPAKQPLYLSKSGEHEKFGYPYRHPISGGTGGAQFPAHPPVDSHYPKSQQLSVTQSNFTDKANLLTSNVIDVKKPINMPQGDGTGFSSNFGAPSWSYPQGKCSNFTSYRDLQEGHSGKLRLGGRKPY